MSSAGPGPKNTGGSESDSGGGLVESEVREVLGGILVGGILTGAATVAGFAIDIVDTVRSGITDAAAGIREELGQVGDSLIGLVIETPLEVTGDLAGSTWLAAPIVSALLFALVAAMAAGIVYGIYRAVVILT